MTAAAAPPRPPSPARAKAAATAPKPAAAASTTAAVTAAAAPASPAQPPPSMTTAAPSPPAQPLLDRDGLQACVEAFVKDSIKRDGERLAYDPASASAWAAALARDLRGAVRAFLMSKNAAAASSSSHRYKVLAHVSVTQRVGQGLARSAGCLWAGGNGSGGMGRGAGAAPSIPSTDGCGWAAAENDEVGVVAEAYVLYVV